MSQDYAALKASETKSKVNNITTIAKARVRGLITKTCKRPSGDLRDLFDTRASFSDNMSLVP